MTACAVLAAAALTSAATTPQPVLIATGQVLDAQGGPVAGLTIGAFVEPTDAQENAAQPGQNLALTPFASTTTAADGTWTLTTADVATLARDTDGTIPVLIWGSDARGTVMRTIALNPPQDNALQVDAMDVAADATTALPIATATSPAASEETVDAAGVDSALLTSSRLNRSQLSSRVTEGESGAADIQMTMGPAAGTTSTSRTLNAGAAAELDASAATSATAPCPTGNLIGYALTSRYQDRPVAVANAYSASKTKNRLQYATTNGTSFQVGVTYSGRLAGVSGMQKSSDSSTVGVTLNGLTNTGSTYNLTFRFRKWDIYCTSGLNYETKFSGYSQWRPYMWTGGNSFSAWTPFTCPGKYRASTTASSWWVSQGVTVTRSGAFTISGGALKATQSFTSSNHVRLTYLKRSTVSSASYSLCGNNAPPASASLVREG